MTNALLATIAIILVIHIVYGEWTNRRSWRRASQRDLEARQWNKARDAELVRQQVEREEQMLQQQYEYIDAMRREQAKREEDSRRWAESLRAGE